MERKKTAEGPEEKLDMLLQYLQKHSGETLQGEELCKHLGIKKDVLSRHCKKLKDQGHRIISGGYTYFAPKHSIPERAEGFQEYCQKRVGRPCAAIPADLEPLLKSFRNAMDTGIPFYRTGKRGVYARRAELPEQFNRIGRDRLEGFVSSLIKTGNLQLTIAGALRPR